MASAWDQLEQMLTCAICLDKFKNPRLLPCQHTFCGDTCMDGLIDYARRQIKCPECRAEHRIPYQGVQSLPVNVTLIRFLELHSKITGDEPEPVPTFLEKCSVCGEKVEGVARCCHCEKKVCKECKVAHLDIMKREITRLNGQTKRSITQLRDIRESISGAREKLSLNAKNVRTEIETLSQRLIQEATIKQKKLIDELSEFTEREDKTLKTISEALDDELAIADSNVKFANTTIGSGGNHNSDNAVLRTISRNSRNNKHQDESTTTTDESTDADNKENSLSWNDKELVEMKDVFVKSSEFMKLFEPDLGDFSRKIRFVSLPDFDTLKRKVCELGELKFGETSESLIANALLYCEAQGRVAQELCQKATNHALARRGSGLGAGQASGTQISGSGSTHLQLPGMQSALMRSQSDHRLASQFQQQQQQLQQQNQFRLRNQNLGDDDPSESAFRSRYAPPASSASRSSNSKYLVRDWPRPGDSGSEFGGVAEPTDSSNTGGVQFKSAFMRRKEKEKYSSSHTDDFDSSHGDEYHNSSSGRVRFNSDSHALELPSEATVRLISSGEGVEFAPLTGVVRLDSAPYILSRIHELGAKELIDKKLEAEQAAKESSFAELSRVAMQRAAAIRAEAAAKQQQMKQKMDEKDAELERQANRTGSATENARGSPSPPSTDRSSVNVPPVSSSISTAPSSRPQPSVTTPTTPAPITTPASSSSQTTVPSSTYQESRRGLYGQAITDKSKRQAQQEPIIRRRQTAAADLDNDDSLTRTVVSSAVVESTHAQKASAPVSRRTLRSTGRSMSTASQRQSSIDSTSSDVKIAASSAIATPPSTKRRLTRGSSSIQQQQSSETDNTQISTTSQQSIRAPLARRIPSSSQVSVDQSSNNSSPLISRRKTAATTTPSLSNSTLKSKQNNTTSSENDDEDDGDDDDDDDRGDDKLASINSRSQKFTSARQTSSLSDNELSEQGEGQPDAIDSSSAGRLTATPSSGAAGKRSSREFLPSAVNRLLDRSAQIRRDSHEQRGTLSSGTNSPTTAASTPPSQSSYFSSRRAGVSGYDSGPSGVASSRRLAYQRTQSIRDSVDSNADLGASGSRLSQTKSTTTGGNQLSNSNSPSSNSTSAYTSARSSQEETSLTSRLRRQSGGGNSSSMNTTSIEQIPYQSRFLSKSRTSAALNSSSYGTSNDRNDSLDYLSSRFSDRCNSTATPTNYSSTNQQTAQQSSSGTTTAPKNRPGIETQLSTASATSSNAGNATPTHQNATTAGKSAASSSGGQQQANSGSMFSSWRSLFKSPRQMSPT